MIAGYDAGPLSLTAAYESLNKIGIGGGNADANAWKAGGSYTIMNAAILALIYENVDLGGTLKDRNAIYGSVAHKIGDTTLRLAIANADKLGSGLKFVCHLKCLVHQRRIWLAGKGGADHPARIQVEYRGQVRPSPMCPNVSDVTAPHLMGAATSKSG